MTHRIPALLAACVGLFIPMLAAGTTAVVGTNISLSGGIGIGDFQLTVFQDATATDFTCALFDFDGTNVNFVDGASTRDRIGTWSWKWTPSAAATSRRHLPGRGAELWSLARGGADSCCVVVADLPRRSAQRSVEQSEPAGD